MSVPGVGAVYCPELHPLFAEAPDLLPVVEVEPQMFWRFRPGRLPRYALDDEAFRSIAALPQRKIVHGVGFPVGGTCTPDPLHRETFRQSVAVLNAAWASEHLSFNTVRSGDSDRACGFFLPPCQTQVGVDAAVRNIRAIADDLPVPFAFETGVNYLRPQPFELSDGEYFARVAESANCDILLDLHNLWANERNGRQPLEGVLQEIPLGRVREVHLAGGMWEDGYWLDAHCGEVPEALFDIAADVIPRLPNLAALVLEVLPEHVRRVGLPAFARQAERMHDLWHRRGTKTSDASAPRIVRVRTEPGLQDVSPEAWEAALATAIEAGCSACELPPWLAGDGGVPIYRALVREARHGDSVSLLRSTCTLILLAEGTGALRSLLDSYAVTAAPSFFSHAEAAGFAAYLGALGKDTPFLTDVLAFERALLEALLHGRSTAVEFSADPTAVLGELAAGRLPADPPRGRYPLHIEAA